MTMRKTLPFVLAAALLLGAVSAEDPLERARLKAGERIAPAFGPRRERMARKKFERKMLEKPPPMLKAAVGAEQVQKTKDKLFESAYA